MNENPYVPIAKRTRSQFDKYCQNEYFKRRSQTNNDNEACPSRSKTYGRHTIFIDSSSDDSDSEGNKEGEDGDESSFDESSFDEEEESNMEDRDVFNRFPITKRIRGLFEANDVGPDFIDMILDRDLFNRFPIITRTISRLFEGDNAGPDFIQEDSPECLTVFMNISGLDLEKVKLKVRNSIGVDLFVVTGELDETFGAVTCRSRPYICFIMLRERLCNCNINDISDIKAEIGRNSGELKVTIPKLKPEGTCIDHADRINIEIKHSVIDH